LICPVRIQLSIYILHSFMRGLLKVTGQVPHVELNKVSKLTIKNKISHSIQYFLVIYIFCILIYFWHIVNKKKKFPFVQSQILIIIYGKLLSCYFVFVTQSPVTVMWKHFVQFLTIYLSHLYIYLFINVDNTCAPFWIHYYLPQCL
jgi:hypothetical protein